MSEVFTREQLNQLCAISEEAGEGCLTLPEMERDSTRAVAEAAANIVTVPLLAKIAELERQIELQSRLHAVEKARVLRDAGIPQPLNAGLVELWEQESEGQPPAIGKGR